MVIFFKNILAKFFMAKNNLEYNKKDKGCSLDLNPFSG